MLLFRRMARLLPLYYAVVLIVWTTTNPSLPGHWEDLLLHLTFTHVYSDDYIFWTIGPAWTLGVEFHFYVLMALSVPLVHLGIRHARSRAGRIAVVSALPVLLMVTGGAYLAWRILVSQPSHEDWSVWFSPLSRAADFGIGTGLAVLAAAGLRLGRWGTGPARRRRRGGAGRARGHPPVHPRRRVVAPGVRRSPSPSPWPGSCCTTARGRAPSSGGRWSGSAASATAST